MNSIEWLENKWSNEKEWSWEKIQNWFDKAKEMHKQEIIKAYDDANGDEYFDNGAAIKGRDYYNETFKKD